MPNSIANWWDSSSAVRAAAEVTRITSGEASRSGCTTAVLSLLSLLESAEAEPSPSSSAVESVSPSDVGPPPSVSPPSVATLTESCCPPVAAAD